MSDMITITIDSARLTAALKRLAAAGRDLSPAMRVAAGIMADSVEENFEEEGRPKWRSLAASTVRQRSKEGSWPGKILQRSGSLAQSVTRHSDATSATVGTNKIYAAIQHFGGQAGRSRKVTIPARPFLTLGDDDEEDIVNSFARFLGEAVG